MLLYAIPIFPYIIVGKQTQQAKLLVDKLCGVGGTGQTPRFFELGGVIGIVINDFETGYFQEYATGLLIFGQDDRVRDSRLFQQFHLG